MSHYLLGTQQDRSIVRPCSTL